MTMTVKIDVFVPLENINFVLFTKSAETCTTVFRYRNRSILVFRELDPHLSGLHWHTVVDSYSILKVDNSGAQVPPLEY